MKQNKQTNCYWNSINIDNKSAMIAFYEYYPRQEDIDKGITRIYHLGFGVGNNRKQVSEWMFNGKQYIHHKITGTNNIKFLIWAKNQILEFETFIKSKYNVGKIKIVIEGLDDRRFKVYKKGMVKYGYEDLYGWNKMLVKLI